MIRIMHDEFGNVVFEHLPDTGVCLSGGTTPKTATKLKITSYRGTICIQGFGQVCSLTLNLGWVGKEHFPVLILQYFSPFP